MPANTDCSTVKKMQNWIDLMHPEDRNEANRVFQSYLADETDTGIYETFFSSET